MVKELECIKYPLCELLEKDWEFVIPDYQRPYAWTQEHTSTLFNDLYEFFIERVQIETGEEKDSYFLGTIVLNISENESKAFIIDGQQRLTTLTIILAAIASKLPDADFINFIVRPGSKAKKLESKPRLTLRNLDQPFFYNYIQAGNFENLVELEANDLELDNETKKNIQLNSLTVYERLNENFKDDLAKLLAFGQFLILNCSLITVTTPDQRSAFQVFDVLNDRGLNLSATDKIKTQIIGKIEPIETQIQCANVWEYTENQIGRKEFLELFEHIRMIHNKKRTNQSLYDEFLPLYQEKDPIHLFNDIIKPYADSYRYAKSEYINEGNPETKKLLTSLNLIDFSDWIPPTLYFLSKYKKQADNSVVFFTKLERLSAYLHICGKDVNVRVSRYAEIIEFLEREVQIPDIQSLELTESEIDELKSTLDGPIYEELTVRRREYLILRLDSILADESATYDRSGLTVEHVLPQKIESGSEWDIVWSEDQWKIWLHRLANLVPLSRSINSSAQNYDFETKKSKYFAGENGVSSYVLTTQIIGMKTWTPTDVEKRQKELLEVLYENWSL